MILALEPFLISSTNCLPKPEFLSGHRKGQNQRMARSVQKSLRKARPGWSSACRGSRSRGPFSVPLEPSHMAWGRKWATWVGQRKELGLRTWGPRKTLDPLEDPKDLGRLRKHRDLTSEKTESSKYAQLSRQVQSIRNHRHMAPEGMEENGHRSPGDRSTNS